nr:hypothetical protein [Candidatus Sigynarchaeota archaeon]
TIKGAIHMQATPGKKRARALVLLLVPFAAYFIVLGVFSNTLNIGLMFDLVVLGLVAMACSGMYLYIPARFKVHANGLVIMIFLIMFLIGITNVVIQIFLVICLVGDIVYFVFIGAYTACIDQRNDHGITSEAYIKDFDMHLAQGEQERGFLQKKTPVKGA